MASIITSLSNFFFFRRPKSQNHKISSSDHDFPEIKAKGLDVRHHEHKLPPGKEHAAECAVCLCKVEQGDEVRELRCDHLFHRVCLDRWVGYKNSTCPLCRGSLAPAKRDAGIGDEQVLVMNFSISFISNRRRSWWLR